MNFQKKRINDDEKVKKLAKDCRISPMLADLLISRDISTPSDVNEFLYGTPDDLSTPYLFPDMNSVTERITKAFVNGERILAYGDYDCDGVGAITIFTLALKDKGHEILHYIPTRAKEGYGLNVSAIDYIKQRFSPDLLITVDCGINSVNEVAYAKSLGMDVIVTDHHQPNESLPDCLILNPFLAPGATPLCGAGVVFTLVRALFGNEAAIKYFDVCAISTLADIVPLRGDNRIIVKYGMDAIKKGRCRPGIKELLYSAKVDAKNLTTGDVGFKIAPRINAAGRLQSAEISLKLLTDDDPTELALLAEQLASLNTERQDMNAKIFDEAVEALKQYDFSKYKIIMLKGDWLEGIVGIVCAKLAEYFNFPVIMVCRQEGKTTLKGSARSIAGINLFELFDKNNEKLVSYGGHEMAAGVSMEEKDFEAVRDIFNDYVIKTTDPSVFVRKAYYDEKLDIASIDTATIKEIELLEPFGHKNPIPVFLDTSSAAKFKQIGRTQHVKAKFKAGELVAFDKLKYSALAENNGFDVLYTFDKNYFNGKVYTQFMLKEMAFKTNSFTESLAAENFCKTFLSINKTASCGKRSSDKPTLYIAYTPRTAEKIIRENEGIDVVIYNRPKHEIRDSLVIAPDIDYPFFYYSKIIFADKAGNGLRSYIKNSGIKCEFSDNDAFKYKISTPELRELYTFLKKKILPFKKYASIYGLQEELLQGESNEIRKIRFITGCYIFIELDLLNWGEDGIITVKNKKVELTQSSLYRYING